MQITEEVKDILFGAEREIVSGIGLDTLDVKASYTRDQIGLVIKKIEVANDFQNFTCEELKMLRNLLCDLLRELDAFEFSTRMGYSLDEVFSVFKNLKEAIDTTCYPKRP